jgi:uncharacterized protein YecE (DUF72 family)
VRTADFLYVRLMGDRELTAFDRIQRDYTADMAEVAQHIAEEGQDAGRVLCLLSNRYMGYAPETAKIMARLLGLPEPELARARSGAGQKGLADFA